MRIISPFYDYYDSVQAQGQDQTLIYLRAPREIVSKTRLFPFVEKLRHWGNNIVARIEVIGFCGRVYPVLLIQNPRDTAVKPVYCYNVNEIDAFVERQFKPLIVERYYAKKKRSYWSERWNYTSHNTLVALFQDAEQHAGDYAHLFRDEHAPIFRCWEGHETRITYNACLKDVQFFRVFDPFTAFQEIQMFLGGMAFPEKPIPKIDDMTMAAAKGFDKFSFRKPKSK
jgi:hypothetical protein